MDKISLRQIISSLSKGGCLPEWLSLDEIKESILAIKKGARNFTGQNFISYAILEDDGVLSNILYIKSSQDATMLLKLLQEQGDE